jgi:hypothetical protein
MVEKKRKDERFMAVTCIDSYLSRSSPFLDIFSFFYISKVFGIWIMKYNSACFAAMSSCAFGEFFMSV